MSSVKYMRTMGDSDKNYTSFLGLLTYGVEQQVITEQDKDIIYRDEVYRSKFNHHVARKDGKNLKMVFDGKTVLVVEVNEAKRLLTKIVTMYNKVGSIKPIDTPSQKAARLQRRNDRARAALQHLLRDDDTVPRDSVQLVINVLMGQIDSTRAKLSGDMVLQHARDVVDDAPAATAPAPAPLGGGAAPVAADLTNADIGDRLTQLMDLMRQYGRDIEELKAERDQHGQFLHSDDESRADQYDAIPQSTTVADDDVDDDLSPSQVSTTTVKSAP